MALTKVKLIADGTIVQSNLHASHGITTADIGENASYLYYTDARARAAVSVSGNALSYNSSTGVITSNFEESPTFTGNVVIDGTTNSGRLFVEQSGADMIDMTRTSVGTYRLAISTSDKFSIYDVGAASDRLVIDSSGNVGIGTTSPDEKLDVENGNIRLKSNSDGSNGILKLYDAAGTESGQIYPAAGDLKFYTPNDIIMSPTGNVGIGTTSPAYKMTLSVNPSFHEAGLNTILNSGGANQELRIISDAHGGGGRTGDITFYTANSATATEKMRIDSSGIIGINKTSGLNAGGFGSPKIVIKQSTNNEWGGINIEAEGNDAIFGIGTSNDAHILAGSYRATAGYKDIIIKTGGVERLRIDNTQGYIGIGTTSPSQKLEVSGVIKSISTGAAQLILNGDTNNSGDTGQVDSIIDFLGDGNPGIYGYRINTENWSGQTALHFQEYINGAYTSRLYINKDGNVGIGTASTSAKLHVVNNSTSVDTAIFESSANSSHDCIVTIKSPRDSYLIFQPANTSKWAIIADYPATGDFDIYNYPNNFNSMTFKDNKNIITNMAGGNFGIGTTTPSKKLHVATTALFGPNGSTSRSTDGVGITFTNNNTFSANGDITDGNRYLAITNDSTTANTYAPLSFRVNPNGGSSNAMADIKLVSNGSTHHLTTTIRNPATGNFIDTISIAQDGKVGIGTVTPRTKLDVEGGVKAQTVEYSWHKSNPITSTNSYRHYKTTLYAGSGGNTMHIMGGFTLKAYSYSANGYGEGSAMFHNWSGILYNLSVTNRGQWSNFVRSPYISSDGYVVIVCEHNTYSQPIIDFYQFYTPYGWRSVSVSGDTTSNSLTGAY